jgi:Family of unknown function (DUF5675)
MSVTVRVKQKLSERGELQREIYYTVRPMEIRITNRKDDGKATMGTMFVDGQYECDTLEPSSDAKYPRIPAGRYPVEFRFSPRFQMVTPHVCNVSGREYILIHPGNKPEDTEGCLLVGESQSKDWVGSSREAFLCLMTLLRTEEAGNIFITYEEAD